MPSDSIEDFRRALSSSKKIIILSGAGLSAASGKFDGLQNTTGLTPVKEFQHSETMVASGASMMPFPWPLLLHLPKTSLGCGSFTITGGSSE